MLLLCISRITTRSSFCYSYRDCVTASPITVLLCLLIDQLKSITCIDHRYMCECSVPRLNPVLIDHYTVSQDIYNWSKRRSGECVGLSRLRSMVQTSTSFQGLFPGMGLARIETIYFILFIEDIDNDIQAKKQKRTQFIAYIVISSMLTTS